MIIRFYSNSTVCIGAVELNKHLLEVLNQYGYKIVTVDKCVFYKIHSEYLICIPEVA